MNTQNMVAVFDGSHYCVSHFPLERVINTQYAQLMVEPIPLDHDEVQIIQSWDEVSSWPVCDICGRVFDYMGLTDEGEREEYKNRIRNLEEPYPDRFDFISAYYVYTLDYNDDRMSEIRYRLTDGPLRFRPGAHDSYSKLSDNEKLYYHAIELKRNHT